MSHSVAPEDLMRLLDGELPAERHAAVQAHLDACTECRRDFVIFQRMKGELRAMAMENGAGPSLWEAVSRRLFRPTGWLLLLAGSITFAGWGVYTWLATPERIWTRLATGAVVIGLALLLLSAILDRIVALRTDRYQEIER